jgi:hypothetical protein
MKAGRRWFAGGIIVVCAVAVVVILWPMILAHIQAEEARSQVVAVFDAIRGGATKQEVETEVLSGHSHLNLVKVGPSEWLVQTPLQFGAGNWQLWIEFDGPAVTALRVRTSDSKQIVPEGAPSDRVF